MTDVIKTLIFLMSIFVANLISKQKHILKYYVIMGLVFYLICLSCNYVFSNSEFQEKRLEWDDLPREMYYHLKEAEKFYGYAKERCWYLPQIEDQEKAKYCFTTIFILIGPGSQPSKMILGLTSLLCQYGLDCMNEWSTVNSWLQASAHHYEMYEFYRDIYETGHYD